MKWERAIYSQIRVKLSLMCGFISKKKKIEQIYTMSWIEYLVFKFYVFGVVMNIW